jgi:hypothetical protein
VKVAKVTAQTLRSMGAVRVPASEDDILPSVERRGAPQEVVDLAAARAQARTARDWQAADDLKARIEAAGWRVVDNGLDFTLRRARPPDVEDAGRISYGAPDSVPSLAGEPETLGSSVVVVLPAVSGSPAATLAAVREHSPEGCRLVVVASRDVDPAELSAASEVIWTATSFSAGAALRAALRRVTSEIIVVLDPRLVPTGDVITPLREVLAEPSVAIAGAAGSESIDLWHYEPASGDVSVVSDGCYAFRRRDVLQREPLNDRLALAGSVATWLSLLLREGREDAPARRAVVVALPLAERAEDEADAGIGQPRLARRDAYRIADRFRGGDWPAAPDDVVAGLPGDGSDGQRQDDDADERGHPSDLA